jgi:hypothetical protein
LEAKWDFFLFPFRLLKQKKPDPFLALRFFIWFFASVSLKISRFFSFSLRKFHSACDVNSGQRLYQRLEFSINNAKKFSDNFPWSLSVAVAA